MAVTGVQTCALPICVSLAARTLDRAACGAIPFGTHWLWHLLNACVLYALIATAARYRRRVPD